jgi:hypothetical protein
MRSWLRRRIFGGIWEKRVWPVWENWYLVCSALGFLWFENFEGFWVFGVYWGLEVFCDLNSDVFWNWKVRKLNVFLGLNQNIFGFEKREKKLDFLEFKFTYFLGSRKARKNWMFFGSWIRIFWGLEKQENMDFRDLEKKKKSGFFGF